MDYLSNLTFTESCADLWSLYSQCLVRLDGVSIYLFDKLFICLYLRFM